MKKNKKKLYFIIVSIIQIVFAIYTILNAQQILEDTFNSILDLLKTFPQEFRNELMLSIRKILTPQNVLINSYIYFAMNLIILYVTARFDLASKKKLLIILSIIGLLFSGNTIGMLLLIINIIIIGCTKSKSIKESKTKISTRKNIPVLNDVIVTNKQIVFDAIFILIYLTQQWWGFLIPNEIFYVVLVDIIMFVFAIVVFYKVLKRDFKLFNNNLKVYIKYLLPKIGIMYLVFGVATVIVATITGDTSNVNQQSLENLPMLYLAPTAIIYAPVVEEIVFRGILKKLYKNKKLFIILSALFFGFLHTVYEPTILKTIMNAIPYALMGGYLAYIYTKTNNIFTTMTMHLVKNLIAVIFIMLSVLF